MSADILDDLGTLSETTAATAEKAAALAHRLFESLGPALELLTIELGHRRGLYAAIGVAGIVTAPELANATGCDERQVREWLDQQAIAGILETAPEPPRKYWIPTAHRPVLLDPIAPANATGLATMFAGVASAFDAVADAFAGGRPVGFAQFGAAIRNGFEAIHRPAYVHALPSWLQRLPDIVSQLESGGVILDAGCGAGWSTIALAQRFPRAQVIGVDLDPASVAQAQRNAATAGVADRVRFERADVGDGTALREIVDGQATLATVFLALHDMGNPVRALSSLAAVLDPAGALLIADAKIADVFVAPGGPLDRMYAAISVLHRLPATQTDGTGRAHGTVLRGPTMVAWSAAAGLTRATRLAIDHPTWSFYRLDP